MMPRIAYDGMPAFPLLLFVTIATGLILGAAFPQRVEAANFWEFWHDIPVGATTGQDVTLNCGWHGECDATPTSGIGLDWEETNSNAYLAGAAKWNGSGTTVAALVVATNEPGYSDPDCSYVVAILKNWYSQQTEYATEVYTHVSRTGTFNQAIFASPGGSPVRVAVGTVVQDEDDDCPRDGDHVHQYGEDFDATNTVYPDYTACDDPSDEGCENDYSNQTWVHYESWTY